MWGHKETSGSSPQRNNEQPWGRTSYVMSAKDQHGILCSKIKNSKVMRGSPLGQVLDPPKQRALCHCPGELNYFCLIILCHQFYTSVAFTKQRNERRYNIREEQGEESYKHQLHVPKLLSHVKKKKYQLSVVLYYSFCVCKALLSPLPHLFFVASLGNWYA